MVKSSPAMGETQVQSLGGEDPLEKGTATHSSILAWRIPWTIQSMGSQSQTGLSDFHFSSLHYITPPETEQDPAGVPFQGQSLLSTLPRPTLGIPSLLFP